MTDTVSWYVTFGLGTPHGRQYTEIRVPADLSRAEQEQTVRMVSHGLYGLHWAFNYPPEKYVKAISRHHLTLREVVEA